VNTHAHIEGCLGGAWVPLILTLYLSKVLTLQFSFEIFYVMHCFGDVSVDITFNSPLRSSGCSGFIWVLSFAVYFKRWPLEQGSGVHWMTSDGVYGGIEWLFQLKGNEEIEIVFQWFKVQCKMGKLHETCKVMVR